MFATRICYLIIFLFAVTAFADGDLAQVSDKARKEYLREAKVWHQTDIANTNILAGPQSTIAAAPEQEVTCQYVEPQGDPEGYAPKFKCKLPAGQIVRVKYDTREVFGEVAGTHLLWALGFFTDRNYPVKLKCLGCPERSPFHPKPEEARIERNFSKTLIEEDFPGEIGEHHDQGWKWKELDEVDVRAGGSSRAEVDALKLLAVFMQHTDSKQQNQRIGCYQEDIERQGNSEICKRPVLMIQDLGETFGTGGPKITNASSMSLQGWKSQKIWNEVKEEQFTESNPGKRACFGNLTSADFAKSDGLFDPQISEEGRQFLAQLLNQLSDQQIHDLFSVGRADKTGDLIDDNGTERQETIEDWVAVFKDKRQQINEHRCY